MELSTLLLADPRVNRSRWRVSARASKARPALCSSTFDAYRNFVLAGFYGKTSQERSRARMGALSDSCSAKWMNSGIVSHGEYWTRNSSEWPSDAAVCFLSDILEPNPPQRFSLSPTACQGILNRAVKRGRSLPARAGRSAACAGFKYSAAPRANTLGYAEEQANTLTADWHAPAVLPLQGNMIGRADSADRQGMAMSQYGTEIAGCLTARGDSSPCADRGQNIVCMTGTQAHCHISNEIAGCLTAHMGKDDAPVVVGGAISENAANEAFGFAQNTRNEVRIVGDGTLSGALAARPGMKQTTFVCTGSTYPINEQIATRDKKLGRGTGLRVGADGDPSFTLLANHLHMVASEIGDKPAGVNPMLVRRLTPLECERLQGFPDEHTLIAWKGKPAEECPDGPRYKAIGNSMAVPVMRWIGRRIAAVDKN